MIFYYAFFSFAKLFYRRFRFSVAPFNIKLLFLLRLPIEVFILLFSCTLELVFELLLGFIASEANVFSKHAKKLEHSLDEDNLIAD